MCLIAEHCTTVRTLPIIDPNPAFVGNRPLQDDPLQVRQGSVPPPAAAAVFPRPLWLPVHCTIAIWFRRCLLNISAQLKSVQTSVL